MTPRVVLLHADAPAKPAVGSACNGCGVCCAAEPCPLGMLISRRRRGPCSALLWDHGQRRYRCGAVAEPGRFLRWLPPTLAARMARRWIAAARGCDSTYVPDDIRATVAVGLLPGGDALARL